MPYPISGYGLVEWETDLEEQAAIAPLLDAMTAEFERRRLGPLACRVGPGAGLARFEPVAPSPLAAWKSPWFNSPVRAGEIGIEASAEGTGYRVMYRFRYRPLVTLVMLLALLLVVRLVDALFFSAGAQAGALSSIEPIAAVAVLGLTLVHVFGPKAYLELIIRECTQKVDPVQIIRAPGDRS